MPSTLPYSRERSRMAKILVVDDSEAVRHRIRKTVETAGHQVVEADNGQSGLDVLSANPDIKLILCDVNMPVMDGLAMCKQVHENPTTEKIPIFMITTSADQSMKLRGKAVGVIAWIVKPIEDKRLLSAVSATLARSADKAR